MYLEKHEFNGETFVKLDDLNGLIRTERVKIAKRMQTDPNAGAGKGVGAAFWAGAHTQLSNLNRKVNMGGDGEKYVVFHKDDAGNFVFLMDIIRFEDVPEYFRRHIKGPHGDYIVFSTMESDEATLYNTLEEANIAVETLRIKANHTDWNSSKLWMFEIPDARKKIERLFYGGSEVESDET